MDVVPPGLALVLLGLLVEGQKVVHSRHTLLEPVHHQRPVLIEEVRHRPADFCFPPSPPPAPHRQLQGVKVIEPETTQDQVKSCWNRVQHRQHQLRPFLTRTTKTTKIRAGDSILRLKTILKRQRSEGKAVPRGCV